MTSASARERERNAPRARWMVPTVAALAAVAVFRGNLAYFFGQDDFLGLARARGMVPPLAGPWRWLSGQGYFALMRPFGVSSALPYHAASLIAHAAAAALLAHVLMRRFSAPAALLAALLFATHAALYTALYSVSGIGELLCGLFALATIAVASRSDSWRWMAVPLFALALISKESVILLPIALSITPGWLSGPRAGKRDTAPGMAAGASPSPDLARSRALIATLAALAIAYAASLFASDVFGMRSHLSSKAPYALGWGPHVFGNAASYLGWTVNMLIVTTRSFEDVIDPSVAPLAVVVALLWGAGLFWKRLRDAGWWAGGATFAVLITPVLGLRNHTYHYYLDAPLIGAAWCAAALFDSALGAFEARRPGARAPERARSSRAARRAPAAAPARPARARRTRLSWTLAIALGAGLVANGAALVHKIEVFPFTDPRLRADPVVDRARITRRVYDGLLVAALAPGTPLLFWSPASLRYERQIHPGLDVSLHETYWERNVRTALTDGLAVRVLFPQVGPVTFVHEYRPAPREARFVLYDPDGSVSVTTPALLDSILSRHPEASGSP